MTEEEARAWAEARFDTRAMDRLERLAGIVADESGRQNLIARSTLNSMWARHITDSLQLVPFAQEGVWLDIGTGAGFPGLVVAAVEPDRRMLFVEPRRLRAEYLRSAAEALTLTDVTVIAARVETVRDQARVISARAVARIASLLSSAAQCANEETVWLLPKGRNAEEEVAEAGRTWHGEFHVEQSITSPGSAIVIARGVRRR